MHAMMSMVYDGKLHLAPIGATPQRILDVGARFHPTFSLTAQTEALKVTNLGTGSGIWCIEMGDLYPSAEITGVDLSANMPEWVPPNVRFVGNAIPSKHVLVLPGCSVGLRRW